MIIPNFITLHYNEASVIHNCFLHFCFLLLKYFFSFSFSFSIKEKINKELDLHGSITWRFTKMKYVIGMRKIISQLILKL